MVYRNIRVVCMRDGLTQSMQVVSLGNEAVCSPCSMQDGSEACAKCLMTVQKVLNLNAHYRPDLAKYPSEMLQDVQSRL